MKRKLLCALIALLAFACFLVGCNNSGISNIGKTHRMGTEHGIECNNSGISNIGKTPKEKLSDYIVENSSSEGDYYYLRFTDEGYRSVSTSFIVYNSKTNEITFQVYSDENYFSKLPQNNTTAKTTLIIHLNESENTAKAEYTNVVNSSSIYTANGSIDKNQIELSNKAIDNIAMTGTYQQVESVVKDTFKTTVVTTLFNMNEEIKKADIGISLKDFGFVKYE